MQNLIKEIRAYLNMSQTEFAELLNVSFATVNRWENGRAIPNKLAQSKMYDLCRERSVSVYDMTLNKIAKAAEAVTLQKGRILLYHGSKSGIDGDIAPISRSQCDFGKGFYMGTDPGQALTLICDYEKSRFYIVSVDIEKLAQSEVPADIDWAMLVAYHRGRMEKIKGTDFYNKYRDMTSGKDLLIGNIANDRMFYVIDNFFIGNVTDAALVSSLSALQLGKQYVAISEKGCRAVKVETEVTLSYLERLFMKEVAEENRTRGISLANDICKNYRREGLYFDEILEKAGRLFELSAEKEIDSAAFIKAFMMSETAKALDSDYNRMQWAGEEYLFEEVVSSADDSIKKNGEIFSADVLYWIGYIYRYWHYYTGEDSTKIYKQAPVETMKRNYMIFHTMDPSLAIEDLKEIHNQKN